MQFCHHLDVWLDIGLKLTEDCVGFATKLIQRNFDDCIPRAGLGLIVFFYSNKKARISSLIILRNPYEMPPKSYETFHFSLILSFSRRIRQNGEGVGRGGERWGEVGRGGGVFLFSFNSFLLCENMARRSYRHLARRVRPRSRRGSIFSAVVLRRWVTAGTVRGESLALARSRRLSGARKGSS